MSGFKHLERIEAYLEGSMDEAGCQQFEADLRTDAVLRAEHDAYLAADEAAELMAFREMLEQSKHGAEFQGNTPPRSWTKWPLYLALLVAVLLAWLLFFREKGSRAGLPNQPVLQDSVKSGVPPVELPKNNFSPKKEPKSQQQQQDGDSKSTASRHIALAKSLYEPVGFSAFRGNGGTPAKNVVAQAAAAYDSLQFGRALELASSLEKSDALYLQSIEIKAHAAFNLNRYGEAAAAFRELSTNTGDAGQRAEGYLLLCLLANGQSNSDEFKAVREKIKKSGEWHPSYQIALKLSEN